MLTKGLGKIQKALYSLKVELRKKTWLDTTLVFHECLNKLDKELCSKNFIFKRELEKKSEEITNEIFKPILQKKFQSGMNL